MSSTMILGSNNQVLINFDDITGNVSIGSSNVSPSNKLYVEGSIYTVCNVFVAGTLTSQGGVSICNSVYLANSNDPAEFPSFSWTQQSNVGMYLASNQTIGFSTDSIRRMIINNIGQVGIGKNPTTLLDVSDSITAQSNIFVNSNLYVAQNTVNSNTLSNLGNAYFASNVKIGGTLNVDTVNFTTSNVTVVTSTTFNSNLYIGCNLGIGTSNPISQLDLRLYTDNLGTLLANFANSNNSDIFFRIYDDYTVSNIGAYIYAPNATFSNTVSNLGNEMIGSNLLVKGISTLSNTTIIYGVTSNFNQVSFQSNIVSLGSITVSNVINISSNLTVLGSQTITSNLDVLQNTTLRSNLSVYTTTTLCNNVNIYGQTTLSNRLTMQNFGTQFLFTSNNNIGINTTSPGFTLDVNGSINALGYCNLLINATSNNSVNNAPTSSALSNVYAQAFFACNLAVVSSNNLYPQAAFGCNTAVAASNRVFNTFNFSNNIVYTFSNVGIGLSNPAENLAVASNFSLSNFGKIVLWTSNSFLGIGLSNPGFTVDINGSINALGYCNLLINSFSNPSLNNAPTTLALSNVYAQALFSSNTAIFGSNLAVTSSNILFPQATFGSNTAVAASNRAFNTFNFSNNIVYTFSNVGIGLSNPTENLAVRSNFSLSNFGKIILWTSNNFLGVGLSNPAFTVDINGTLNAIGYCNLLVNSFSNPATNNAPTALALSNVYAQALFASNLGVTSSNILFPQALFGSNSGAFGSNLAVTSSNILFPQTTFASNSGAFGSNSGAFGSNLAVTSSNILFPQATFGSNLAVTSSNILFPQATFASNSGAFGSNNAAFGSNSGAFGSNLAVTSSNILFPQATFASNSGSFGSNSGVFGSNLARTSSNILFPQATFASNSGAFGSNLAVTSSNILFPQTIFASNSGAFGSNTSIAASNLAFNTFNFSNNIVYTFSNVAIGLSNTTNALDVLGVANFRSNVIIACNLTCSNATFSNLTINSNAVFGGGAYITRFTLGGTWIDLPLTGPSGVGTGGPGANPFLAYVAGGGQWFTNAATGDNAYRNTTGRLLFGNTAGDYAMGLSNNKLIVNSDVFISGTCSNASGVAPTPGNLINTVYLTSGTSYTPTLGTNTIRIELLGGGGGGGGTPANTARCGSGGGAGAYGIVTLSNISNISYTYSIGAGGTGTANAIGGTGGTTSIIVNSQTYSASGGLGGNIGINSAVILLGGVGGSTYVGTLNFQRNGNNGDFGCSTSGAQGSGSGGNSQYGIGGQSRNVNNIGNNATGFGAGGGGAANTNNATARAGGTGSPGIIIIQEFT